jgi:hypothetical protein
MATRQELERQLSVIGESLANVNINSTGEQMFFQTTGEQKLSSVEEKTFTDVYNEEYEQRKDIQFTVSRDAKNRAAFYVYNPAKEAEKATEKILSDIEKVNTAYEQQQQRLTKFKEERKQLTTTSALDVYLDEQLKAAELTHLKEGLITPNSPLYNMNKAREAVRTRQAKNIQITVYNPRSRRMEKQRVTAYVDQAAAAAQLQGFKLPFEEKFKQDTTLQTKYVDIYKADLLKKQRELRGQLDKLLKAKK